MVWATLNAATAFLLLRNRDSSRLSGRPPVRVELQSVLTVATIVPLTVGALGLAIGGHDATVLQTWLVFAGCLVVGRLLLRGLLAGARSQAASPTAIIVGTGRVARQVATRLYAGYGPGLRPIGFIDDAPLPGYGTERHETASALPVLGALLDLDEVIERHRPECVVVAFSLADDERLVELVRQCWDLGVEVFVVPRLYELQPYRSDLHHLGRVPLQPLLPTRERPWAFQAKMVLDRVAAAAALVALAPLLLLVAAAVRLSIGSPVLFRQTRVGRHGRHFDMLKFRTMRPAPEFAGEADASWAASIVGAGSWSGAGRPTPLAQPRCTAITSFLRRYSLDELPQLINILRGEMSWIGPRPERAHYVEIFEREVMGYADRQRMPVGLTGWAQIHGLRGETSLADRVEWDNAYIDNWSPWLDLSILCRTLPAVARSPNRAAGEHRRRVIADEAGQIISDPDPEVPSGGVCSRRRTPDA
jgi:exopolysaccharide biosynthesis polyprenyl glycosylphosphotransferase